MMIRFRLQLVVAIAASFLSAGSAILWAQEGALVRTAAKEAVDFLTAQAGKQGSTAFAKELADVGGEIAVREVFEQVAKEGGENGIKTLLALTKDYGMDAILAAKVSPGITTTFIEQISPALAPGALRALARPGERTIIERLEPELVPAALEASARHPGVGAQVVEKLGVAGERASQRYDTDAVIQLVRSKEADWIEALPAAEKKGLTSTIADFIEAHPKTSIGITGLALFEMHKDQLLGGKGQIVVGPDGKPVYVPETGMIERLGKQVLDWVLPIVAAILALWGANRLFWAWRWSRRSHEIKSANNLRSHGKENPEN